MRSTSAPGTSPVPKAADRGLIAGPRQSRGASSSEAWTASPSRLMVKGPDRQFGHEELLDSSSHRSMQLEPKVCLQGSVIGFSDSGWRPKSSSQMLHEVGLETSSGVVIVFDCRSD